MKGLSEKAAKAIEGLIKAKFDSISLRILGLIPKVNKEKRIVFSTTRTNLISLFLQSLGSRDPNKLEEETLKVLLRVASGYIDALRDRTTSKVLNGVDAYIRESTLKDRPVSMDRINEMVEAEMDKAGNHLKLISNSESNKAVNTGAALKISKMAEQKGEADPTVFFVVTQDDRTGFYEYVLHLLPDRVTPRVWKLSEISADYYHPGDQYPCFSGLHPHCRCKLTYLASGWGFKDGKIAFIGLDHDEFEKQREKYGLPEVPEKAKRKDGKWFHEEMQ